MYSSEMIEYLKEIKRYLVWRYGITDSNKEKQPTRIAWAVELVGKLFIFGNLVVQTNFVIVISFGEFFGWAI